MCTVVFNWMPFCPVYVLVEEVHSGADGAAGASGELLHVCVVL